MSFVSSENGAGTGRVLRRYYRRLHRHFGPQRWWPARTRFEVILGALLTQNTSWANVKKALNNLRRVDLLNPSRLSRVRVPRLERLLRPSGYFRQKTRAVRHFLSHVENHYAGSCEDAARARRASFARNYSTSMVLAKKPPIRCCSTPQAARSSSLTLTRAACCRATAWRQERAAMASCKVFHFHLPRQRFLFNEYHALLVSVGKGYCHRQKPNCDACPLGPELERSRAGL
jgi:endonuclease-3 related protein